MNNILTDFAFVHDWSSTAKLCIELMNTYARSWKDCWDTNTWFIGQAYWIFLWKTLHAYDIEDHNSPQVTVQQALKILSWKFYIFDF